MAHIQKILEDVTNKLDEVLPSNVRCVIVCVDTDTGEASATSDLSEEDAIRLLEDGIKIMKMPIEPVVKKSILDSN